MKKCPPLQIRCFLTNVSKSGDGVECKKVASASKWYFPAGSWKSKRSAGTKYVDMEVTVIEGMIECIGIDGITKARKNRENQG